MGAFIKGQRLLCLLDGRCIFLSQQVTGSHVAAHVHLLRTVANAHVIFNGFIEIGKGRGKILLAAGYNAQIVLSASHGLHIVKILGQGQRLFIMGQGRAIVAHLVLNGALQMLGVIAGQVGFAPGVARFSLMHVDGAAAHVKLRIFVKEIGDNVDTTTQLLLGGGGFALILQPNAPKMHGVDAFHRVLGPRDAGQIIHHFLGLTHKIIQFGAQQGKLTLLRRLEARGRYVGKNFQRPRGKAALNLAAALRIPSLHGLPRLPPLPQMIGRFGNLTPRGANVGRLQMQLFALLHPQIVIEHGAQRGQQRHPARAIRMHQVMLDERLDGIGLIVGRRSVRTGPGILRRRSAKDAERIQKTSLRGTQALAHSVPNGAQGRGMRQAHQRFRQFVLLQRAVQRQTERQQTRIAAGVLL